MKLSDIRPNVETSGEFQDQMFGIQDPGMLFDILRNKMYSNPIGAICREISCNARDAHREVGKTNVPIEIRLPNALEPFYKIKDQGPGISPDRMANIFVKYTASTKREDNVQTGGFGLGAKTPFSYSDSFVIITIHNGKKYNYSAIIDETRVGKMSLAGCTDTDEANGTEIIIPVKSADFAAFRDNTERSTLHWDVQPKVFGGTINYDIGIPVAEGNNWKIISKHDRNSYNKNIKLIIDGIEYPIDLTALKGYSTNNILQYIWGDLYISFGIGEISLAASRESVYLDKPTQQKISKALDAVLSELKQKLISKIDSIPTLWEAWQYAHSELRLAFANLSFLGTLNWRGHPIKTDGHLSINTHYNENNKVFIYKKGTHSRKHGHQPDKIDRGSGREIQFKNNSVLFINDLGIKEPGVRHVKKLFETDTTLESIQVISLMDDSKINECITKHNLKELGVKMLSSISTAKKYKPASARVLTFAYNKTDLHFKQSSYSAYEETTTTKVLAFLKKDNFNNSRSAVVKNATGTIKQVDHQVLDYLLRDKAISIWGIDQFTPKDRIEEDFEDVITLDEYIENYFDDKNFDALHVKHCVSSVKSANMPLFNAAKKYLTVLNPNSLLIKYLNLCQDVSGISEKQSKLLSLYETFVKTIDDVSLKDWVRAHPNKNLISLARDINIKYPLLSHISPYDYDKAMPDIIEYIKLVDSK